MDRFIRSGSTQRRLATQDDGVGRGRVTHGDFADPRFPAMLPAEGGSGVASSVHSRVRGRRPRHRGGLPCQSPDAVQRRDRGFRRLRPASVRRRIRHLAHLAGAGPAADRQRRRRGRGHQARRRTQGRPRGRAVGRDRARDPADRADPARRGGRAGGPEDRKSAKNRRYLRRDRRCRARRSGGTGPAAAGAGFLWHRRRLNENGPAASGRDRGWLAAAAGRRHRHGRHPDFEVHR